MLLTTRERWVIDACRDQLMAKWLSLQERAWKSNLKYLSSWPSLSLQLSLAILLRPSFCIPAAQLLLVMDADARA